MKKKVLLIAGFDPLGKSGLLRDIQVLNALNLECASLITAQTVQSDQEFVSLNATPLSLFKAQLQLLVPLRQFSSIKIGMMANDKLLDCLIQQLKKEKRYPPIVCDPLYCSTSGGRLLNSKGTKILWNNFLGFCDFVTPNLEEYEFYSQSHYESRASLLESLKALSLKKRTSFFLKAYEDQAWMTDIFVDGSRTKLFKTKKIDGLKFRGTGCLFSTMLASYLALGYSKLEAAEKSHQLIKRWIKNAIQKR